MPCFYPHNLTAERHREITQRTAEVFLNKTISENKITERIIGCAIKVHKELGPGLLESAYEACLYYELIQEGLFVERQRAIPLVYKEVKLDCGYRADLIVERKIVVELKSVEALNEIHLAQAITHLKLTNCTVGLLINFNVLKLKDGIQRVVNNYKTALRPLRNFSVSLCG